MLFVLCQCAIGSILSQELNIEVYGKDTFPMAIIYHGMPVSVFTDSQTTQIASLVEMNNYLQSEVINYQEEGVIYKQIIAQKDTQINTIQSQLQITSRELVLEKRNEVDLQNNISDYAKKCRDIQMKGRLKTALGTVGGFLFGGGVGLIAGLVIKH